MQRLRTEGAMDKVIDNNKKTTCPICGHVVENGFCRNCFLKDVEKAEKFLNKASEARKNYAAYYQIKKQQAIKILIIILIGAFIIGFCIGWLFCVFSFH